MYGDAHGPQVVDPHNAADHISPKVIEDEDLPYWLPVWIEEESGLLRLAICIGVVYLIVGALLYVVI